MYSMWARAQDGSLPRSMWFRTQEINNIDGSQSGARNCDLLCLALRFKFVTASSCLSKGVISHGTGFAVCLPTLEDRSSITRIVNMSGRLAHAIWTVNIPSTMFVGLTKVSPVLCGVK